MILARAAAGFALTASLALASTALPSSAFAQMGPPALDPAAAAPGPYKLDKKHASVTLKLTHMGLSHYTMRFDAIDGGYSYDPAHPAASKIAISIDPASVDTDDANFNKEIADQFLEAGKYPAITFTSTSIVPEGKDHGKVSGELTFHGVTKPVTLDVTYNGSLVGMMKEHRMGFSGHTTIKRSEFGVTKYVPLVGDDVSVLIEAEFVK
jgi:polyisoprenoid-binding protein YceI